MNESETERTGLRAREEQALLLLLAGKTPGEICAQLRMSKSALFRLRQTEKFRIEFQNARQQAFDGAVSALHSAATVFVSTLRDVCTDPNSRDSARATAARSGLDSLWNAQRMFDFEKRLLALEAEAEQKGGEKFVS